MSRPSGSFLYILLIFHQGQLPRHHLSATTSFYFSHIFRSGSLKVRCKHFFNLQCGYIDNVHHRMFSWRGTAVAITITAPTATMTASNAIMRWWGGFILFINKNVYNVHRHHGFYCSFFVFNAFVYCVLLLIDKYYLISILVLVHSTLDNNFVVKYIFVKLYMAE